MQTDLGTGRSDWLLYLLRPATSPPLVAIGAGRIGARLAPAPVMNVTRPRTVGNTPTPDRNASLSALSSLIGATVVPFRLPALFASALVLHVIRPSSVFHDHSTTISALLTSYQT